MDRQTNRAYHEGHDFGFVNFVAFVVAPAAVAKSTRRTYLRFAANRGDCDDATVAKTASAAVDADLLAVSEHHALEPDDLLAVGELIAGARDHVTRLDRRPSPASRLHSIDRRPSDQPFLLLAAISLHLDDVTWEQALAIVVRMKGLGLHVDSSTGSVTATGG